MIQYGKQSINDDDIEAVVNALKSDWLTQGPIVKNFEDALSKYCGSKYAVAVSNGTAALHLANQVIGARSSSKIITSPISFVATSNSILYCQATPIFVDICPETYNIDPKKIEKEIHNTQNVEGIIVVHLGGVVAQLEMIREIADKYNLWIIEDACHALGGKWVDSTGTTRTVGDCRFSDLTTFSFHPVKHITTAEGGAVLTNNRDLYEKIISLRSHGMIRDPEKLSHNDGDWYYEIHDLGYNYRLPDINASLGLEQIKRADKWKDIRKDLVYNYDIAFKSIDLIAHQRHPKEADYSYHLYIIRTKYRKELYNHLKKNGVFTQIHYIPIHLQPLYKKKFKYKKGDFPQAESYYDEALSLPLHPSLTERQQKFVIKLVIKFFEEYDKNY